MKKSDIAYRIFTIIVLALVVIFFGWIIIDNFIHGWTTQNIIDIIYSTSASGIGMVFYSSFLDFLVRRNTDVIFFENKIYDSFITREKNGTIGDVKKLYLRECKKEQLDKINKLLKKDNIILDDSNIDKWFDIRNRDGFHYLRFSLVKFSMLENAYKKYSRDTSEEFEKLYRSIHNNDFIKKPKFPLIELLVPLFFGLVGAFGTVYQCLTISGEVSNSLFDYIKVFASISVMFLSFAFMSKNNAVESKIETLEKIKRNLDS